MDFYIRVYLADTSATVISCVSPLLQPSFLEGAQGLPCETVVGWAVSRHLLALAEGSGLI